MSNDRLKFRAWDKWRKQMIHPNEGDFIGWHAMSNWRNCLEVMQWTGKTDCDGLEIYDEDWLDHPEFEHPIRVSWNNDSACFESCGCISEWPDCRVIGNLYENPELLDA